MTATTPPDALAEHAARQYGLVTLEQALGVGWTREDIARRLAERSWVTVRRGVYRSAAAPVMWRQRALAACLGPGGAVAVCHGSAAYLHGLVPSRPFVIDVVIPYGASPRGLAGTVRAHRSRRAPGPAEVVVIESIQTTSLVRTLVDLAAEHPGTSTSVAELVDRAMVRCPSDNARAALAADIAGWRGSGCRGAGVIREALEPWAVRSSDDQRPQSVLEAQVLREITRACLPRPTLQHRLDLPTGPVFLDLAWPDERVALEVDGYRFHSGRDAFDRDRRRGNALLLAGWNVLHTTAGELAGDPFTLMHALRVALGVRAAARRLRAP